MTQDRGTGQYLPEEVATNTRARYEAHHALEINDYLFGGLLSSGSLVQNLPAGNKTDILFENVDGSGLYYDVKPSYVTNGRLTAQKHLNVTVNAAESEFIELDTQKAENVVVTVDNGTSGGSPEPYTLKASADKDVGFGFQEIEEISVDKTAALSHTNPSYGRYMRFEIINEGKDNARFRCVAESYRERV